MIDAEQSSRPVWRRIADFPLVAMVVAILLYAAASTLASIITFRTGLQAPDGISTAVHAVLAVGLTLLVYKIAIRHLGEHPRDDLAVRAAAKDLSLGLLAGAGLFSATVAIAAMLGVYRVVGCCSTAELVKDLFGTAIFAGFMEELLFRGILFRWMEEFAGSWAALLITSALFGFGHIFNPNATWFTSLAISVEAGLLLGGAYMLTRSLWMPIGLHAAWNFTQGFVFDVPVSGHEKEGFLTANLSGPAILSGGAFGLEASIIALATASVFGCWLVWLAVKRGNTLQPRWLARRIAA